MRPRRGSEVPPEALAAYADGEVTPSEAETIEGALADSTVARRQLDRLRTIREQLSSPAPELESLDLVASIRRQIEQPVAPPRRRGARVWGYLASACIAAAATFAIVREHDSSPSSSSEFRAKSGRSVAAGARWAGIQPYFLAAGAQPEPLLGRALPRGAGLLFSYTNLGPRPFDYLMVFVRDARGQVHWCYPAYLHAGTNPGSMAIASGQAETPLPELIQLELAPGPATFHALFSMTPLRVLDVEHWLESAHAEPPPWPEVSHQTFAVGVGL